MTRNATLWGVATLVLTQACTGCPGPDIFTALKPFIHVDACTDRGIKNCTAEFGTVRQGLAQTILVSVRNARTNPNGGYDDGEADLNLIEVKLGDNTDPAFAVVSAPTKIAKGDVGKIEVKFSPVVASQLGAQLIILSDAGNLDQGQTSIVIDIGGTGQETGVPHLVITPPECDFGEVAPGVLASCDVSLANEGTLELRIETAEFTSTTPVAMGNTGGFVAPFFPVPNQLSPGSGVTMRVQYRPQSDATQYEGAIQLTTTDPAALTVLIPLHGRVGDAPTAVARVESVNSQPPSGPAPTVQPLDNVILTGADSVAGGTGRSIIAYEWTITSRPEGSTVELTQPTAMTTGFQFNSSGVNRPGLDVAGTYVISLRVEDSSLAWSTNDARVTLNSVPAEDLHIQLTWEDPHSDIDLHVVRNLGPRFSMTEDCYYLNCKGAGLNWGGGGANPHLDVDDTDGYGPENININTPLNANYTVGVHWYSGSASAIVVNVRIYVQGALLGEYVKQLSRCNQYWDVAKVIWGAAGASLQDVDVMSQDTHGGCF
ncbi:MAG: choice-of-anchor D domain-containing protein [Deltaproteobacteria bacterium]|nr:choice-of-anchor D domain-containing protein [Deltaproteobacteria bacterium]